MSLDKYLAEHEPVKAALLKNIIGFLLTEFPRLQCKIAWKVPHLHLNGKYVMGLAIYAKHLSINPWRAWVIDDFKDRLAPLTVLKRTFQVPADWLMDKALLRDLVQARLNELA